MECPTVKTLEECGCTKMTCPRRGKCCECVRHHRNKGEIPGCFFPVEAERSHDRSMANFIRSRGI